MDDIVPFIMRYSPYITTSSQFEELFGLYYTSDDNNPYRISNFCSTTQDEDDHTLNYHFNINKLQNIIDENIDKLRIDERVFRHFEYVCSIDQKCYNGHVNEQIGALNLLRQIVRGTDESLEQISPKFIALIKIYLILKWTIWTDVHLVEDCLVELDDAKIEYKIYLTHDVYPFWGIHIPIPSNNIRENSLILNVLSQLDRRVDGVTSYAVVNKSYRYYINSHK